MDKKYTTYLYTADPKNGDLGLPEIRGEKCVAFSNGDVFEQRDDAFSLIARIAGGDIPEDEIAKRTMGFLIARGYEHTYGTLI